MRYIILLCLFCNSMFSQTKEECLNFIKRDLISVYGSSISTELKGTILIIKNKTITETIDLKSSIKIIVDVWENGDKFLYEPVIIFNSRSYSAYDTQLNEKFDSTFYGYHYFKKQEDAIKMRKIFKKLAILCGAELDL